MRAASPGAMRRRAGARRASGARTAVRIGASARLATLVVPALLAALLTTGCSRSDGTTGDTGGAGAGVGADADADAGSGPQLSAVEAETLRARSEAQFDENNFEQAYEILQPLLKQPEVA